MNLFRVYDEVGRDGYPTEWHWAIKNRVRELAGERCERCKHPYVVGANKMERIEHASGGYSYESWSPCDALCEHEGPFRYRNPQWRGLDGLDAHWFSSDDVNVNPPPLGDLIENDWDVEARFRILTVHHLDGEKANCLWWNLIALCQRCHLNVQRRVIMGRAYIFEHTPWFKPYAAGFYAWKYLQEYPDREETMRRLDELLALERLD